MLQAKLTEKDTKFNGLFDRYKSLKHAVTAHERADSEFGMGEVWFKRLKDRVEPQPRSSQQNRATA